MDFSDFDEKYGPFCQYSIRGNHRGLAMCAFDSKGGGKESDEAFQDRTSSPIPIPNHMRYGNNQPSFVLYGHVVSRLPHSSSKSACKS